MPSVQNFRVSLKTLLYRAHKRGLSHIDIKASDLHRRLEAYPGDPSREIPSCCQAMYAEKKTYDVVIVRPPEGEGATLTIRFKLPRTSEGRSLKRG
jgi:hypothetical protein